MIQRKNEVEEKMEEIKIEYALEKGKKLKEIKFHFLKIGEM